jgi:DNA-directed RNA polymerase subunit E'/Rpb7
MEQIAVFQEKVSFAPFDLHDDITSFDEIILSKLKKQLEGKCSKHGFVIPGSLEILSRSMGVFEKGRATADALYYVKAQGKVYNPPEGLVIEGEVKLKNKMGCYVIIDDAVRIMIPRDLHIGNDEFDSLEIGDRIQIEIKKSQYRANATHVLSIGQFLGRVGSDSSAVEEAQVPEVQVEEAKVEEKEESDAEEQQITEDNDEEE